MTADALSDVLKTVRLTGATFFDVVARSPWVAEQPSPETILPKVLHGAGHLISYHVVTQGRCYANIVGEESIAVEAGEVIVFTRGDAHVMSSSPGMRAEPNPASMYDEGAANQPFFANIGDDGPIAAKIVCGFLACDSSPFNPLLDNLPPVIKVAAGEGSDTRWLSQFIHVATTESADKRAGGESVLAQIERADVHRGRSPASRMPAARAGGVARGPARSVCRQGFVADACTADALLDDRRPRARGWPVTLGSGREICTTRRHSANALSRQMADADCLGPADQRQRQHRDRRRADRLWIRSGLQPRVQENGGGLTLGLASPSR